MKWKPDYIDRVCEFIDGLSIERGSYKTIYNEVVELDDETTLYLSCTIRDIVTSHYPANMVTPEEWHGYREIYHTVLMMEKDGKTHLLDPDNKEIEDAINRNLKQYN